MKFYNCILIFVLVYNVLAGYNNVTSFWQNLLKEKELHFQAYTGYSFFNTGYEEIDWYYPKNQSGMYYSLFSAAGHKLNNESSAGIPLIVWFQGGPGGSSQYGAFQQFGPIRVQNETIRLHHASWNIFGHLLFPDQPLNVGFSFKPGNRESEDDQVSTSHQAADHVLNFLDNFYKTWPSLRQSPLYLAGQSFGGHWAPAFAKKLIINETWRVTNRIKFEGIMLGDGWVDPMNQVNNYDSYLWSAGIADSNVRDLCTWFQTNSMISIQNGKYEEVIFCLKKASKYFQVFDSNQTFAEIYFGNISIFNIKKYDGLMDISYVPLMFQYKDQLGGKVDYIMYNLQVYDNFAADISISYEADLVLALRNVKVLVYNGQLDFIVNTPGVLQYLNSLNWEGINQWKRTKKQIWTIHGQHAGWTKISGNLWFVLVNEAGHLVPADQPERAFSMMGHFLNDERQWKQ